MIFVPLGYVVKEILNMDEIIGGSPWGAATLAGATGARQPSELELTITKGHAKHFTGIVSQFVKGA